MTNEHLTSNEPTTSTGDGHNVIAVSFEDDDEAYHALTLLTELGSQQRVGVQEAVVVVRGEDGQLVEKDGIESPSLAGTASGGLLGLLLGIIGGPFGVLIGGATGLMVGSLFDLADYEESDSTLSAISSSVKTGHTSLLAVVVEQSPDVVDATMSQVGGTVLRRSVAEVEAEIAAAEQAERKAKHEARKELIRARHDHSKAAASAKVEELKAKLHRGRGANRPDGPNPSHEQYQEMDRTIGVAEQGLLSDMAATDKGLDDAAKASREHAKSAAGTIRDAPGHAPG